MRLRSRDPTESDRDGPGKAFGAGEVEPAAVQPGVNRGDDDGLRRAVRRDLVPAPALGDVQHPVRAGQEL